MAAKANSKLWYAFTAGTKEGDAVAIYEKRYGVPPERILEEKTLLLLGPVPEGSQNGKNKRSAK